MTADPRRTRDTAEPDGAGQELACPGWAHPLTRHAADRFGSVTDHGPDTRVAVIWTGARTASALLTHAAEIRSRVVPVWRAIIAIRVAPNQPARVLDDPASWLDAGHGGGAPRARDPASAWDRHFAAWLPPRIPEAAALAGEHAARQSARALADHAALLAAQEAALQRWLERRALELCGDPVGSIEDLFGHPPNEPDWRTRADPADRLAALMRDPTVPAKSRQDADLVLSLWRDRARILSDHAAAEPAVITPIGLLMCAPGRPG